LQTVQYVCGQVNQSATYFPIARTSNWRHATFFATLTKSQRAALVACAVLYFVFFVIAVYRLLDIGLVMLLFHDQLGRRKGSTRQATLPMAIFSLLSASLLLRWLYFVLILTGSSLSLPKIVEILFAELPTYLFFSIFMLLVFWCVQVALFATAGERVLRRLRFSFLLVNCVMYCLLLVVVIVYVAVGSQRNKTPACSTGDAGYEKQAPSIVAKVYRCIVAALAAVISIAFLLFGGRVLLFLGSMTVAEKRSFVLLLTMTITVCVGLLVQCALLLYDTFASSTLSTDAACTLTVLFELIPALAMFVAVRPLTPPGRKQWLWCFEGSGGTGSSSTASTASSFQSTNDTSAASSINPSHDTTYDSKL